MEYLYLFISLLLASCQRGISARKNGVFYGKKNPSVTDSNIKKWIANIHIITNQEYRAYYGSLFFFLMSFLSTELSFWWSILTSLILTQLTSAVASYSWQKWINLGSGLPPVDPNEPLKYELTIFDKSYWIPKFWRGKRRIWISIISGIILTGILYFLYSIKE